MTERSRDTRWQFDLRGRACLWLGIPIERAVVQYLQGFWAGKLSVHTIAKIPSMQDWIKAIPMEGFMSRNYTLSDVEIRGIEK